MTKTKNEQHTILACEDAFIEVNEFTAHALDTGGLVDRQMFDINVTITRSGRADALQIQVAHKLEWQDIRAMRDRLTTLLKSRDQDYDTRS